jgi:hypothetical protein
MHQHIWRIKQRDLSSARDSREFSPREPRDSKRKSGRPKSAAEDVEKLLHTSNHHASTPVHIVDAYALEGDGDGSWLEADVADAGDHSAAATEARDGGVDAARECRRGQGGGDAGGFRERGGGGGSTLSGGHRASKGKQGGKMHVCSGEKKPHPSHDRIGGWSWVGGAGARASSPSLSGARKIDVTLVAHSMGAAAALIYLVNKRRANAPHRVSRAVLMSPAGYHHRLPRGCRYTALDRLVCYNVCACVYIYIVCVCVCVFVCVCVCVCVYPARLQVHRALDRLVCEAFRGLYPLLYSLVRVYNVCVCVCLCVCVYRAAAGTQGPG